MERRRGKREGSVLRKNFFILCVLQKFLHVSVGKRFPEVGIGFGGGDASAGGAGEESELDEEGFVDVFDGFALFARCGGDGLDADGTTREFVDHGGENVSVGRFETEVIDFEEGERFVREFLIYGFDIFGLCVVADALQEAIGDARRAPTRLRDTRGARGVDANIQYATRPCEDAGDFFFGVELESVHGAEAIPERVGNGSETSRRADQREFGKIELNGARRRTLADNDVEFVVLHRRVEHFFDEFVETMDFVDEEYVAVFEIGEDRAQVADALDRGATRHLHADAHFFGDDVGECRLAQARRTIEKHVLYRVAALSRRFDKNAEIPLDFLLPDIFAEPLRAERRIECGIVGRGGR